MSQKITRREFALRAASASAALAAAPLVKAQDTPKPTVSDAEMAAVQAPLASPMPAEAKKYLKDQMQSMKTDTANRLKHSLPENSEPCFIFVPTPKRGLDQ
jgi:hypothetical protein